MIRRLSALFGALILLTTCTTHYRNALHPSYGQVEFDKDWYECRRENTHPAAAVAGVYGSAGMMVDEGMAKQCMAARGWQPYQEPPPSPRSAPASAPLRPTYGQVLYGCGWRDVEKDRAVAQATTATWRARQAFESCMRSRGYEPPQ